jgi:hypothetical protein
LTDLKKKSNIKFHEKLSSGSRVAPCGQTEMAELTAAFQNFAKTLKSVNAQEHDTTAQ